MKKGIWLSAVGITLVLVTVGLTGCDLIEQKRVFTDETAHLMVSERLVDMAQTPEAKEYVALLFPSLPEGDFVERYDDLGAWKYIVDYWPAEARSGFENAKWFTGDYDNHFLLFKRPTWAIYDDDKIVPLGGAILVEADIDKLNEKRTLE